MTHAEEIGSGRRFEFGKNWQSYLALLDEHRIDEAKRSLTEMLGANDLRGKTFLDIGSGSGLSSLVARQLGARVHSFDFDPKSVACTTQLRDRYFPGDHEWSVTEGSVLDANFLRSLGTFDIVYSWGVLHHTGNMWRALDLAAQKTAKGGLLFVAIYNDQGLATRFWRFVKKGYCSGWPGRVLAIGVFFPVFFFAKMALNVIRHGNPVAGFSTYSRSRGMSLFHDWIDWLGGYPFEASSPTSLFRFYRDKGFTLRNLATTNGLGCNQYVFESHVNPSDSPEQPQTDPSSL